MPTAAASLRSREDRHVAGRDRGRTIKLCSIVAPEPFSIRDALQRAEAEAPSQAVGREGGHGQVVERRRLLLLGGGYYGRPLAVGQVDGQVGMVVQELVHV